MIRSTLFFISFFLCALVLLAQNSTRSSQQTPQQGEAIPKKDKEYVLSVDVQLVTLPVSVLDSKGRFVNDLTKDNFQVFEDSKLQQIALFKHEDIPLSLGLVIDNSGSMRNKRERVNAAALNFVRES